jgi:hypothetical protein
MTEKEEQMVTDLAEPFVAMGKMEERKAIVSSLLTGCQKKALRIAFEALQESEQFDASARLMANFRETILGDMQ